MGTSQSFDGAIRCVLVFEMFITQIAAAILQADTNGDDLVIAL